MTCPSCKLGSTRTERVATREDGVDYDAQVCTACDWRSDAPPVRITWGHEAATCEGCRLPFRAGEFVQRWADGVVAHVECPRGARA